MIKICISVTSRALDPQTVTLSRTPSPLEHDVLYGRPLIPISPPNKNTRPISPKTQNPRTATRNMIFDAGMFLIDNTDQFRLHVFK